MSIPSPQLNVTGPAGRSLQLTRAQLAALPEEHQVPDVEPLARGRRGRAVRLGALADAARVDERSRFCHVASTDGSFTANLPMDEALAGGLVLYELDGADLPASFGGPFRLLFPDSDDCSVNVKFLGELRFLEEPGSHTAHCADEDG